MATAREILRVPLLVVILLFTPIQEAKATPSEVLHPAWGAAVREDIAAREYWITWQEQTQRSDVQVGWQAPNRAQGFRICFTPTGVRVIPRTSDQSAWEWGLSLMKYGRGALSRPVEPARLLPDENRIRLDRHEIDEWFISKPQGLKHGFVLHAPPDAVNEPIDVSCPVHLDLIVGGSLIPVLETDGRSVRFVASSGLGVVYYAGLEVHDGLDRDLPAWMEVRLASDVWTIRLLVDDREAAYPIEIDPVATTAVWIGEMDQEAAWFGYYVRTAGDVNGDGYDDVIVTAPRYDNGETNEGAAFLYLGSAEGPSLSGDWIVDGDEYLAFAGCSGGTAGDVNGDGFDDVIVGVPRLDSGAGAWVFHGSPFGLAPEPDWIGQGGPGDEYGYAVGTAGDVNGDGYDDVIVGAYLASAGQSQEGQAFVYHGSATGLLYGAAWEAEGNQANSSFGVAVSTAGDVNGDGYDEVIVGAWEYDNGENEEGRAYVYYGGPSGLSTEADWIFENDDVEACLGYSVGSAGDVDGDGYDDVIVGAPYKACTNFPASPVGRVYVFRGSASGLPGEPDWIAESTQTGAVFGNPVATAGDVNSDGYDDVIVGARYYDNDLTDQGAAFLFLGSEEGLSAGYAWMVEGDQAGAWFGAVGPAGDVNGDGVADVIVGAHKYDNGEEDEGRAYVYLGAPDVPAGWVETDTPLLLIKEDERRLHLTWGPSCLASDLDYEVYEGRLGDFASHAPVVCSTGGLAETTFIPASGNTYYLIVPTSTTSEGSYGRSSDGLERTPGTPACLPQAIGDC